MVREQLSQSCTLRFITTGYGSTTVTGVSFANLLDAWCVAATATTAYQLFDFVKIRRVTVRAVSNPAISGTVNMLGPAVTVELSFPGLNTGVGGSGRKITDSALGTNSIAMVSASPGRDALASMWQVSNNGIAFVIRVVDWNGGVIAGAVIDVELSYKNDPDVSPVGVTGAVAAAIPGNLYYRGIDGGPIGGTWARSIFTPRI